MSTRPMSVRAVALVCAVFLGLAPLPAIPQSVPQTINFQGRLTDNTSQQAPIDGVVPMKFAIWDAQTPGAGTKLWEEPASGAISVTVTKGLFSIVLGSQVAIPASVFAGATPRYLEITIDPLGTPEVLSPRQLITSTAYAHRAQEAVNASTVTNGVYTSGSYADPAWLTSVSGSKVTGTVSAAAIASTANAFTGNLSGDVTGTQGTTAVARVGGKSASEVASSVADTQAATSAIVPNALVRRDGAGNIAGTGTNGRNGANALLRITDEPAGTHCAAGGKKIEAGTDDGSGNGIALDGVLQPGEVTQTTYVCNGQAGTAGCDGVAAGGTAGLTGTITVSAPSNGSYFTTGERPLLTMNVTDRCGRAIPVGRLGTAQLFLAGPRRNGTTTASGLLNCVTDRSAPDRQHHYVNLAAPHYADPAQGNLATGADGSMTYTLAPVSSEHGTYTAALWVKSADELDQAVLLADVQIGTPTVEAYASGAPASSACGSCHSGPDAKRLFENHGVPTTTSVGNWALDQQPVATCQLCHNADGYSVNTTVRKAHAVHRGAKQLNAGAAHPEYGAPADASLASYTDVVYPRVGGDMDCASCHTDDGWKTAPTRAACGDCHDNLYLDSGTLNPPRVFGRPASGACTADPDCATFGVWATCNTATGSCERSTHSPQPSDGTCSVCHTADASGLSPIATRHEILTVTRTRGLAIRNTVLSGGSGPSGTVLVGDTLSIAFALVDRNGTTIGDLKTNSALSGTVILSGPSGAPQRVLGPYTIKNQGTLVYDAGAGRYTYTFPATVPPTSQAPYNTTNPGVTNAPGTYSAWLYVTERTLVSNQSVTDAANALVPMKFVVDQPVQPRQVVTNAACQSCHGIVPGHALTRTEGSACSACHTKGSVDRTAGSRGASCTDTSGCPSGYEACQDTNNDGRSDTCVMTSDPTPNATIEFGPMNHSMHYARLLGGYAEQAYSVPGKLAYIGFLNTRTDFSNVLLETDVRNCTKCHADTGASCSTTAPCGYGQRCTAGKCVNVSYLAASSAACLSCHDTAGATAHAGLNTWNGPNGAVETCNTCHGEGAANSVQKSHGLVSPYAAPYAREPQ